MSDFRRIGVAISDVAFYGCILGIVWLCLHYGYCS
jgi:hypothetical protein